MWVSLGNPKPKFRTYSEEKDYWQSSTSREEEDYWQRQCRQIDNKTINRQDEKEQQEEEGDQNQSDQRPGRSLEYVE